MTTEHRSRGGNSFRMRVCVTPATVSQLVVVNATDAMTVRTSLNQLSSKKGGSVPGRPVSRIGGSFGVPHRRGDRLRRRASYAYPNGIRSCGGGSFDISFSKWGVRRTGARRGAETRDPSSWSVIAAYAANE